MLIFVFNKQTIGMFNPVIFKLEPQAHELAACTITISVNNHFSTCKSVTDLHIVKAIVQNRFMPGVFFGGDLPGN